MTWQFWHQTNAINYLQQILLSQLKYQQLGRIVSLEIWINNESPCDFPKEKLHDEEARDKAVWRRACRVSRAGSPSLSFSAPSFGRLKLKTTSSKHCDTCTNLHTGSIDGCMSNPSSRADTRGVGFAAARTRHPRVLACCHFQIARPCAARSQLLERSCLGSGTTLRREVLTISATLRTCPSSELIIWAWELLALCRREKLLTIRGKFQRNFAKLLEMNF